MTAGQGTQYALFEVAEASPLEKPSVPSTEPTPKSEKPR